MMCCITTQTAIFQGIYIRKIEISFGCYGVNVIRFEYDAPIENTYKNI
jgi:hypothetical protein